MHVRPQAKDKTVMESILMLGLQVLFPLQLERGIIYVECFGLMAEFTTHYVLVQNGRVFSAKKRYCLSFPSLAPHSFQGFRH